MKVKKLNVKKLGIFIGIIVVVIVGIVFGVKSYIDDAKMKETYEYKFGEKGYKAEEVSFFKENLSEEELEVLLGMEYNSLYVDFISNKYFDFEKFGDYLSYMGDSEKGVDEVISIVNVGADTPWYEEIFETDTTKGNLMLVNKFYGLSSEYEPEVVLVSSSYAYANKYVGKSIYDDLVSMLDAARGSGFTLVVSQGYRSYKDQSDAYNSYKSANSQREADEFVARAGHSEYQTGLGLDIEPYGKVVENVEDSAEHKWLMSNAYKYGFILRYPEGKEDITGFNSNPWRFRYVGKEAARQIYEEGLTFDEYYVYYVNEGE